MELITHVSREGYQSCLELAKSRVGLTFRNAGEC